MTQQTAADLDRKPKEATLELSTEWRGGEDEVMVNAEFMPWFKEWRVRLTIDGASVSLTESDLATLNEHAARYRVALHAVRGTQP